MSLLPDGSYAQFDYNKNLVKPILEDDIMFRRYVKRRVNLKEKQNKGFASQFAHFSRDLQEAYKDPNSGIVPYSPGSNVENNEFRQDVASSFSAAAIDFVKKQAEQQAQTPKDAYDEKGEIVGGLSIPYGDWNVQNALEGEALNYLRTLGCDDKTNSQVTVRTAQEAEDAFLHIIEEVVFDKRRSRMYINIVAFQLVSSCPEGAPQPGPILKYKDVDRYFRELYRTSNQKKGVWYNEKNVRRHMCVMDAFELRLFSSRILKVSNADDKSLADIYEGKIMEELYKAQELEMELMEFEHNLWEF
ncbi:MAG: hypothetical protein OHK0045_20160 [Raineya sp.]